MHTSQISGDDWQAELMGHCRTLPEEVHGLTQLYPTYPGRPGLCMRQANTSVDGALSQQRSKNHDAGYLRGSSCYSALCVVRLFFRLNSLSPVTLEGSGKTFR